MKSGYGVVVNVETAARILKISKSTAYGQVADGSLPGLLPSRGRKRVAVAGLEQYLGLAPGSLVGEIEFERGPRVPAAA